MDPGVLLLKKTVPADLAKTKDAIESLSKNALKQSPLQFLPFSAVEDVKSVHPKHDDEKPFLICAYNAIGPDEYLSPHTHRVFTIPKGGTTIESVSPPRPMADDQREREIRNLEKATNEVWYTYTQLYYGWDGIGSVFLRSTKQGYLKGIFGIHQVADDKSGNWDSVHVVQVDEPTADERCTYRVESAVVVTINPYGGARISSSLQKETTKTLRINLKSPAGSHLENLGKIIEDVEIAFRSKLERIEIPQSLDIVESMYTETRDSVAGAASVAGLDESEMPSRTTGMSVGSAMIDDIASEAQKKKDEGSAFLNRMKAQQDVKEAQMEKQNQDYLSTTRSSLKSPKAIPRRPVGSPTSTPINSPFVAGKAALKKTLPKAPISPASPAPEFLSFRNKLKKSGA